jgi:hypothetical protein
LAEGLPGSYHVCVHVASIKELKKRLREYIRLVRTGERSS